MIHQSKGRKRETRKVSTITAVVILITLLFLFTSCGKTDGTPESNTRDENGPEAILETMSLEDKVGQLIIGRCPGDGSAEEMGKYRLGGYTFYRMDFNHRDGSWLSKEELRTMLEECANSVDIAPIFAIDEEGGRVTRLSENPDYFPEGKSASPRDILAAEGSEGLRRDSADKASILKELGLNVNFAPVADLTSDENTVMYPRSLGSDADEVSGYVSIMVDAMEKNGIGTVLKHFPGYGNNEDTHEGMVTDKRPYEEYIENDYKPFQAGIDAGCGAVMMEHIRVEALDPEKPTSLSPRVVSELRDRLGFEGVIMTDDLAMGEMTEYDRDGHVAVEAIQAGNDMVISSYYRESYNSLISAVRSGEITEERLDESVERILKWKIDLGIVKEPKN